MGYIMIRQASCIIVAAATTALALQSQAEKIETNQVIMDACPTVCATTIHN